MPSHDSHPDTAAELGRLAAASLVAEARLTPKPGLVDQWTCGAHTDMDLSTFMASAAALEPLFERYAAAGMELGGSSPAALADAMRRIGIEAERAMFAATGGVNTHKGANFSFALMLGACGALIAEGRTLPFSAGDTTRVFALVRAMGETLLDRDVRALLVRASTDRSGLSHGEQLYLERGVKGVCGEAVQGYPQLSQELLPYLRQARDGIAADAPAREELLRALVRLMATLEDTNVVHRGGMRALADHRAFCAELAAADLPFDELVETLTAYDGLLIRRNVSPGGAADLISLGIFFCLIESVFDLAAVAY